MKKSMIKKTIAVAMTIVCLSVFGCIANAYDETISFGANFVKGFANNDHPGNSSKDKFMTRLTAVNYIGMPSGTMPSGAEVYFRVYKSNRTTKATKYNFHNYNHFINETWKYDSFIDGVSHTSDDKFVMSSNSGESIGATVSVEWYFCT